MVKRTQTIKRTVAYSLTMLANPNILVDDNGEYSIESGTFYAVIEAKHRDQVVQVVFYHDAGVFTGKIIFPEIGQPDVPLIPKVRHDTFGYIDPGQNHRQYGLFRFLVQRSDDKLIFCSTHMK